MTSRAQSRFGRLAPSLVFAAFLTLAGCATSGPPAPISSGKPRVEPSQDRQADRDRDDERGSLHANGLEIDANGLPKPLRGKFTPEFLKGKDLVRAGVLLPFSHPNAGVRAEAEGMLAGIEMALFDHAPDTFVLLPKDTAGSKSQTVEMAEQAQSEGAEFFLGPLFGSSVAALNEERKLAGIPVIAFSNDRDVAGGNTWLASISPEEEVSSLVEYAISQGFQQFAFFGPQSALGQRIETALQFEANQKGARVVATGFYPDGSDSPSSEARYLAESINSAESYGPVAVLIPERGTQLRKVAPLLAYHGVSRSVQLMGLSGWDDPNVWREPSLKGGWFVAPPDVDLQSFETRYKRIYGRAPTSLAAQAYDAAALAMSLSADGDLDRREILAEDGFVGLNGLFRFTAQGTAERKLSIYEVSPGEGATLIHEGGTRFDPDIG
ncbi:MAG: penicillin-binding protein activator [Henriciella sp.]|uniref:penicillin-binding protein activator n=1 Tax=Henriciella sp. TaxID=1968823 RepID=UPI0032EC86B5